MLGHSGCPIRTLCLTLLVAMAFSHRAPTLYRLLLSPTHHAPHMRRSLLAPLSLARRAPHPRLSPLSHSSRAPSAPRSLLQQCAALPAPTRSACRSPSRAKAGVCWCRWWWCSRAATRRRIPPQRPKSTGPSLPLPYAANICFKCFKGMLQLLYMDVAKVDLDVTHVTYFTNISEVCCKRLLKMFHLFRRYVAVSVLSRCYIYIVCCRYFISMLHMFHTHIASILSRYCICFTHMSQQHVSSILFMSDVYCIQLLHIASVLWGHVE
jgi:hypothetical protein